MGDGGEAVVEVNKVASRRRDTGRGHQRRLKSRRISGMHELCSLMGEASPSCSSSVATMSIASREGTYSSRTIYHRPVGNDM